MLEEFLEYPGSKYAIISYESYLQDPVAQSLSPSPRVFQFEGATLAVLSLEPATIPTLVSYVETYAGGVEYELTIGSGKVTLLTHQQILGILSQEAAE